MIPASIAREHAARLLRYEAKVRHENRGWKRFCREAARQSNEANAISDKALELATPEDRHEKIRMDRFVWALLLAAAIAEQGECE